MKTLFRIFTALLLSIAFLSSCNKSINGRIIDNFQKPLGDVEVKVEGYGFNTKSNSGGNFSLDYVPGIFNLQFQKKDYISYSKIMEIAEKQNVPLGDIEMIRIPKYAGMYVKLPSSGEYIKLKDFECNASSRRETLGRTTERYHYLSIPSFDSVTVIKVKSLNDIHFYQFTKTPFILTEPSAEGVVVRAKQITYSLSGNVVKPIKEEVEKISEHYRRKSFTPEYGRTYVYANVDNSSGLGSQISTTVYIFRFEKE